MKKIISILVVAFVCLMVTPTNAQIDVKRLGKQIKRSTEERVEQKVKQKSYQTTEKGFDKIEQSAKKGMGRKGSKPTRSGSKSGSSSTSSTGTVSVVKAKGNDIYVSFSKGNNRNDGTKEAPYKNIQKAINDAKDGDVIRIAEGNYLGLMNIGFIELDKAVSLVGGYNSDFTKRDPIKYQTTIQPRPEQSGTSSNKSLLTVNLKNANVVFDGLILDRGWQTGYSISSNDADRGQPEGVETGRFLPPPTRGGNHGVTHVLSNVQPLLGGSAENCDITIQNCIFLNASNYGIQMGIRTSTVRVINNLFVNSRMAAVEIRGTSAAHAAIQEDVEFAYNTILFAWSRTKEFEDMGYGFRFMTGVHYNIHDNIIGGACFSGLDKTRIDSREASREIHVNDNLFFLNKQADLTLPSQGGLFMRIRTDMFEDVEDLSSAEGNITATPEDYPQLTDAIDHAYLNGFINAAYKEEASHDPNSPANVFRQAMGMNMTGTIKSTVTMFHNYYPLEKAIKLIGAIEDYGMQEIE
ncbi:MAG: DUF1565 domain-containing protein [Bacteroidales bacterium]|jgi:hypothetical protein